MHPAEGSANGNSGKRYEAPGPFYEMNSAYVSDLRSVGDHRRRNCSGVQFILVPIPPHTNR